MPFGGITYEVPSEICPVYNLYIFLTAAGLLAAAAGLCT